MAWSHMSYDWIRLLDSGEADGIGVSVARRRRVAAVIGDSATSWGVAAGRRMRDHILDTLTDWPGDRSDDEVEALGRATVASTLDSLVALYTGDSAGLTRSSEPAGNIEYYVSRGIPLEMVVRNVHAGQEFLTQELVDAIEQVVPADDRLAVIKQTTRDLTSTWSRFTHHVTVQYAREKDRLAESADGARADAVRRILAGRQTADPSFDRLSYPLDQTHTGLVLWLEGIDHETERMVDFSAPARDIASACRASTPPLVVRGDVGGAHVWLGGCARSPVDALRDVNRLPAALRVAVGRGADGADGFRLTHAQARAARRVAGFADRDDLVVAYDDVEVAALLTVDVDRARARVRTTLGPLAGPDAKACELRRTLTAWIDTLGSTAATAAALHTHRNTVTYRLRQIDELIGAERDNTRVRAALEICAKAPNAMLLG